MLPIFESAWTPAFFTARSPCSARCSPVLAEAGTMMIAVRHLLVLIAAGAALVSPAMAGSSRPGSLGGGFIELIMTGRDPTPDRGRAEPSPSPAAALPQSQVHASPEP